VVGKKRGKFSLLVSVKTCIRRGAGAGSNGNVFPPSGARAADTAIPADPDPAAEKPFPFTLVGMSSWPRDEAKRNIFASDRRDDKS
jgi:hypothetical protein